jgi:hypothetical protein
VDEPWDWAQRSKKGEGPLHEQNDVMPLLTRQHVKCTAENKVSHTIKAKPVEKVRSFSDLSVPDIIIDTTLELIDEG